MFTVREGTANSEVTVIYIYLAEEIVAEQFIFLVQSIDYATSAAGSAGPIFWVDILPLSNSKKGDK